MKVFLAFSFRPEDKELVGLVGRLIASQHLLVVNGEGLGGEQLTPAVQARIDECDALVGLCTRRDKIQAGGYTTHQWVRDEIAYARNKAKRAIALFEDGVDHEGMFQPHEYIALDMAKPHDAFLRLSETLGLWRAEHGRTLMVQILPPAVAAKLGAGKNGTQCSYRLWRKGQSTNWINVTPQPEAGGTFIWLDGVQDDHLVQIQIKDKGKVWESVATSQWIQVAVRVGGAQ